MSESTKISMRVALIDGQEYFPFKGAVGAVCSSCGGMLKLGAAIKIAIIGHIIL